MDIHVKLSIAFAIIHLLVAKCYYILITDPTPTHMYTLMFTNLLMLVSTFGISLGAHRLWCHRAYKARTPIRIMLMLAQSVAGQYSIYNWCRFHRTHHKFSDTDGDPHNTMRGFFFAHIGWILRQRHPENKEKTYSIDNSDILADPVARFQHENFKMCYLVMSYILPVSVPILFWGENYYFSILCAYLMRQVMSVHITFFVNSAAHLFGDKPYNHAIEPKNSSFVAIPTYGEGYHNYHHAYPNDYQLSEMGAGFNLGRHLIEWWARIGQAYDLKAASQTVVEGAKKRTRERLDQPDALSLGF